MAETFSYESVKDFMNGKFTEHRTVVESYFNQGTAEIEEGISDTSGNGAALSAASGKSCIDVWNSITGEMEKFRIYVDSLIERSAELSKITASAEGSLSQSVAQTQNDVESIGQ